MSGAVIPIGRARSPRITVTRFRVTPEAWLVACTCGSASRHAERDAADRAAAQHRAAHAAARAAHPAGSALRRSGGGDAS